MTGQELRDLMTDVADDDEITVKIDGLSHPIIGAARFSSELASSESLRRRHRSGSLVLIVDHTEVLA